MHEREPAAAGPDEQRAGWVMAMVIGTTVLTGFGMSIMVVTFPAIRADFPDASPAQLSWINNLFTIVSAATLIPCGVLADRVGRKRMLLAGAALFTAGSFIGALAPSPGWIMVGRTVLALGAASYGPAGTALLISAFPPERLASAIGVWAVVSGVSSAAGPSIGGLVVDRGGWPWAFWLNIPVGLFVLLLGPFVLREGVRDRTRRLPDPLGVALVMAATSVITLGVVQRKTDPDWRWLGSRTLVCFAVGALLAAWLVRRCRRSPNPLVRPSLFHTDAVRFGVFGLLLTGVAFYAVNWALVQHTVNQWGWSITRAGVATCPVAFTSGLSAVASSRAAHRYGQRPFMVIGTLGMMAGCVYLWLAMGSTESLVAVVVGGTLIGVSSGLVAPAYISTTLLGVPADQHSVGSSINFMAQRTSATLGTALAITFIAGSAGSGGLHRSLLVGIVGMGAGLVLAYFVHRSPQPGHAVLDVAEPAGAAG